MTGQLSEHSSACNRDLRMGDLVIIVCDLIYSVLVGIRFMPVEETLQTSLPGTETVRQILGHPCRRKPQQNDKQDKCQYQDTRQLPQLHQWQLADEHHQETDPEQHKRRRKVFRKNQHTGHSHPDQYVFEYLVVGKTTPLTEQEGDKHNGGQLSKLRRLELYTEYLQPAVRVVGIDPNKRRDKQHQHRDGQQQYKRRKEPARDIVQQQNQHKPAQQKSGMTNDRRPMIRILVGDRTRGTEHLNNRNQAQEHEDDPYHPVALK